MAEELQIEFQKWEGTGNTFIIINALGCGEDVDLFSLEDSVVEEICRKENTDGLIVLGESSELGVDMRCDYRNPDGSRSFCGNGTRASYAYARREGWVGERAVFKACDGLHEVKQNSNYELPSVKFRPVGEPRRILEGEFSGDFFLDTGSPHHLHYVKDEIELREFDIDGFGRKVRYSDMYSPDGSNVNAVLVRGVGEISLRTYERGVEAETKACGTGAVAAALTDFSINAGDKERKVKMEGGDLFVEFDKPDEVWLSGKASEMRRGVMKILGLLLLGMGLLQAPLQAQWFDNLSDEAVVSVLTGSPGADTYSAFGHTAIRIYDPSEVPVVDWVFNYGTFSFSDDFYMKFLKGHLDYTLTAAPFHMFNKSYLDEGRGLFEQILRLSTDEVRSVAKYLSWNLQEENAGYRYEFFRDNCASRVIVVLENALGEGFQTNCIADGRTFRDGLDPYIDGSPWTAFGMDFVLGSRADNVMPPCGSAYIPDDLSKALLSMTVNGEPLTSEADKIDLLIVEGAWLSGAPPESVARLVPTIVMVLLALIIAFLRFKSRTSTPQSSPNVNFKLFKIARSVVLIVASALGVMLLVMWTLTDHTDTWANCNLLWSLPALVYFVPTKFKMKATMTYVSVVLIATYLLLSPGILPQFTSISLWGAAISVILALTPIKPFINVR
ncbi:MAG TPA: diaminopimelate epimerase [Flavobacteriales bacterium]|nr:diaminopimelate epimerase [Flavobacteriales bacterium]